MEEQWTYEGLLSDKNCCFVARKCCTDYPEIKLSAYAKVQLISKGLLAFSILPNCYFVARKCCTDYPEIKLTKGQLITKCLFGTIFWPKNQRSFKRISALAK